MYYLIPIPIIFIAAMVKLLSNRYKLKIFSKICTFVIVVSILYFIYAFADYNGYNIIEIVKSFFTIKM